LRPLLLPVLALAILLLVPPAAAETALRLNGQATAEATTLDSAVPVAADGSLDLEFRAFPWTDPDATAARVRVSLLLGDDTEVEVRSAPTTATFVQGQDKVFATEVPLDGLGHLGSGAFRIKVELLDANGQVLFASAFLVKVVGASFLTAEGVLVTSLSLVLAYGVWHLIKDVLTLLGYLPSRRKKDGQAEAGPPAPRPAGFLQALREAPSALRIAGIALSLAVITVMWGHALGLVPLGQETLDALIGKAENALLVAGVGYAALVGAQAWRLRRQSAQEPTPSPEDS
jgi:hypothetical protein